MIKPPNYVSVCISPWNHHPSYLSTPN